MMQEAKSSCAGTWYLPAGRVEVGENLIVSVHFYYSVIREFIYIYFFNSVVFRFCFHRLYQDNFRLRSQNLQ